MTMPTETAPRRDTLADIAARVPPTPPGIPDHRAAIAAAVALIAERFRPERVVLFGSRGRGTPRLDSDIDLMVIVDPPTTRGEIYGAFPCHRHPVPLGIHTRSPEQIRVALTEGDFFIEDVLTEGKALYARDWSDDSMTPGATGPVEYPNPNGLRQATEAWIEKAERDLRLAERATQPPDPIWDGVCFHAQQCAEKYLKAFFEERGIRSQRTHDLEELAALAEPRLPAITAILPDLPELSKHAVTVRYPGASCDQPEAEHALRVATDLRAVVRADLGLDDGPAAP